MKKVGIIGCGNIAQVHAWALGTIKDVKIEALCDIEIQKAEKLADKAPVVITEKWESFLESDLDVIHVCTPHFLHAPMALEILKRGKAVFVEKPCAISLEQFNELKKADSEHPGKLGFCFQNRYNETTLLIERIMSEGRIGNILGGRAFVT